MIASKLAVISILAVALTGFSACAAKTGTTGKTEYVFSKVSTGAIEKTVSGSGTIEPVSSVSVVAQMSGIAEKVYADYNDRVTKGQTLVVLNTDMLELQREEQQSAVAKAQANYDLQVVNYANQLKLSEKGLISEYETKTSKTTLDVDAAELASAKAALKVIETEINQYAFIKSPITGVILERGVDEGQSVIEGSSSNSSSLFTIAENLDQMQIEATVDEVDIASIKKGQTVRFTVEAIAGKTFSGKVSEIHLVPTTSDSVVSYTVIISLDNTDGSLLPGMTAEVEFIVSSGTNVLLVPNAALRYEPTALTSEEIAAMVAKASGSADSSATAPQESEPASTSAKQTGLSALVMGGSGGGPGGAPGSGGPGGPSSSKSKTAASASATAASASVAKNVWYLDDSGNLAVAVVKTGVSDGTNTEITTDENLDGKQIIVKEKVN
jgi:HlyD family secretion protein